MPGDCSIDGEIARLATAQMGRVARAQLLSAGVGREEIDGRVKRGALHVVHPGVYAVGHTADPPFAREMAALRAAGDDAHLGRRSAALVQRIIPRWDGDVEVISSRLIRRPGITAMRRRLAEWQQRTHQALRLTHPITTLIDLATVLDQDALEQATAQAIRNRLTSETQLRRYLTQATPRPGLPALKAAVGRRPRLTRSKAERLLLNLLRKARLPLPESNHEVNGYEVDLVWPEHRLIVEFDGFAYHSDRHAYETDRTRDADLQAAGYRVIRITWRALEDSPEAVLARIARALG
jgi:very-short-patch-repair endonuclease